MGDSMAGEAGRPATRRDLILAVYDQEAMGEVTTRELALIQRALLTAFGEGGAMSPAEIAQVLLSEDLPVRFDSLLARGPDGSAGHPFDRYEELFGGRATPSSLREAKETILFLDRHWRQFQATRDPTGTRYARQTARRARQYAETLAARAGDPPSAILYQEIVQWFAIWLQTPDLFFSWLSLRESTADFKARFPEAG